MARSTDLYPPSLPRLAFCWLWLSCLWRYAGAEHPQMLAHQRLFVSRMVPPSSHRVSYLAQHSWAMPYLHTTSYTVPAAAGMDSAAAASRNCIREQLATTHPVQSPGTCLGIHYAYGGVRTGSLVLGLFASSVGVERAWLAEESGYIIPSMHCADTDGRGGRSFIYA